MNHSVLMGVVDSYTDGCGEMNHVDSRRKLSCARCVTNIVSKSPPLDIVHYDVSLQIIRSSRAKDLVIKDLYNVGMAERGNNRHFALKTCNEVRVDLQI